MKYTGIINRDVSAMVARTGHFDRIVISDAGFPIPAGVPCIDLSMGPKDRKSTRLNSSHIPLSRMPSSA